MIKALGMKYEAEIARAEAAIDIIMKHPSAVAEHPTDKLMDDIDANLAIIADCKDKLEVLQGL